jgi:Uma2 family endonuclease
MDETRVALGYADYAALPDDGRRYEIHDGELSVTPAPGTGHQGVSIALASALYTHVTERSLGRVFTAPIDVILSDTTIVQPDLVFIASNRSAIISARGIEGAPTLVVEILSPSTARIDRNRKLQLYARHGVPYYWIVDSDARSIDVYRAPAGIYTLAERHTGGAFGRLEPFADLTLPGTALWPLSDPYG